MALQGNKQPDISYQYGTNMPQLANTPKLVDLTQRVQEADFNWNDYFPGERDVATVDGRVLGIPALVDNLAVVYNKDLFAAAGVPTPDAGLDLGRLPCRGQGRLRPLQQRLRAGVPRGRERDHRVGVRGHAVGGGRRHPQQRQHPGAFNSAAGVRALTTLQQLQQDNSLYLDFTRTRASPRSCSTRGTSG